MSRWRKSKTMDEAFRDLRNGWRELNRAFVAIGSWWLPIGVLNGRRVPTEAIRAEHRMEDLLAHDPLLDEFHRLRLFTPDEMVERAVFQPLPRPPLERAR